MADSAPDLPKSAQSDFAGGRKFLSATYPWCRPLSYLAVALAALLILNKISSLLPSRLLARAISFACAVAVIGFLFKSYSERVAETSHKLKEEAVSVVKKSQARQQSLPSEHDFSPRAPEAAAVR